jgi:hypothetical protein
MPLDRFEAEGSPLEVRVPWLSETLWLVPTEREAEALAPEGIGRGRVWTARKLIQLMMLRGRTPEVVRTIALAKIAFAGDITAVTSLSRTAPSPRAGRRERIGHVEEVELPKVAVDGIQPSDAMLPKQGCQVGVGNEISAYGKVSTDLAVDLEEPIALREDAHARQGQERFHVVKGLVGRERPREDSGVSGDAQEGHQRGPGHAEQVRILGAPFQKVEGFAVPRARPIGGVEKDVDVDRIAHVSR